jgi:hypothetical protein
MVPSPQTKDLTSSFNRLNSFVSNSRSLFNVAPILRIDAKKKEINTLDRVNNGFLTDSSQRLVHSGSEYSLEAFDLCIRANRWSSSNK